jgi:hypothetical protein
MSWGFNWSITLEANHGVGLQVSSIRKKAKKQSDRKDAHQKPPPPNGWVAEVSFYTAVPRQLLDVSNVGATFKQMGRKIVPQAMHSNMLPDGGNLFKNKREQPFRIIPFYEILLSTQQVENC